MLIIFVFDSRLIEFYNYNHIKPCIHVFSHICDYLVNYYDYFNKQHQKNFVISKNNHQETRSKICYYAYNSMQILVDYFYNLKNRLRRYFGFPK